MKKKKIPLNITHVFLKLDIETPYLMPADEKVEQENLLDEHPETAADLERQLQVWLEEGPVPPVPSSKNVEDKKITEALRALGYIQ